MLFARDPDDLRAVRADDFVVLNEPESHDAARVADAVIRELSWSKRYRDSVAAAQNGTNRIVLSSRTIFVMVVLLVAALVVTPDRWEWFAVMVWAAIAYGAAAVAAARAPYFIKTVTKHGRLPMDSHQLRAVPGNSSPPPGHSSSDPPE